MMIRTTLAALAMAAAATGAMAQAAGSAPEDFVKRHIAAAGAKNVDAIMADYADDAVLLANGSATQGKDKIRAAFAAMVGGPGGGPALKNERIWQEGNVGFVTWTMNNGAVRGEDAFVIRGGKIAVQTVWIGLPPSAPAAGGQ